MTLSEQLERTNNRPSGFDYLRICLSVGVVAWHTIVVCYGRDAELPIWSGWLRPLPAFIIPSFFALSGFLVAGSLSRNPLPEFLALRALRIVPALSVEVLISALLIGPAVTNLPLDRYFTDPVFSRYFFNLIGHIQYHLPGVFEGMPAGPLVNLQLWTVPYELRCYILITLIALAGLLNYPRALLAAIVVGLIVALPLHNVELPDTGPDGTTLVLAFLFGVTLYYLRDRIPYHWSWFAVALALAWTLSTFPQTKWQATLPIAYVTVFLGLQNPRKTLLVAGADYSYGLYLYGFPIQQLTAYALPKHWYINLPVAMLCTAVLAWMSWVLIEARVLGRKGDVLAAMRRLRKLTGLLPHRQRLGS